MVEEDPKKKKEEEEVLFWEMKQNWVV